MRIQKAIIPAAGLGKRYYLSSGAQPKETMPIGTKPVIHCAIEELYKSGISEVLIITNKAKSAIEDYFDTSFAPNAPLTVEEDEHLRELENITSKVFITYARQKRFKGPARAVYEAKTFVKDTPFFVLLPDDLCFCETVPAARQLIDTFERYDNTLVGLEHIEKENYDTSSVIEGELAGNGLYNIKRLVKFPKEHVSNIGTIGRYVLKPDFFSSVENIRPDSNGEYSMTAVLDNMCLSSTVNGLIIEGKRYDIGNPVGHIAAQIASTLQDPKYSDKMLQYLKRGRY